MRDCWQCYDKVVLLGKFCIKRGKWAQPGCAGNINTSTLLSYAVICIAQCYAYFYYQLFLYCLLCHAMLLSNAGKLIYNYIELICDRGERW